MKPNLYQQPIGHPLTPTKMVEIVPEFSGKQFLKLEYVNRPTVETASAAFYLNRQAQTLRCWAFRGDGPIKPIRVHGRLAWPVSEIKRLVGVSA